MSWWVKCVPPEKLLGLGRVCLNKMGGKSENRNHRTLQRYLRTWNLHGGCRKSQGMFEREWGRVAVSQVTGEESHIRSVKYWEN